jgi:hypothetical protein
LSLFFRGKISKIELDFYTKELCKNLQTCSLRFSSVENHIALHNLFIRAILCNAYRLPPPTSIAPPSMIPYAPIIAISDDLSAPHLMSSAMSSRAGILKRRRHILIHCGDNTNAIQEFKRKCLRNTVLALPLSERQRLKSVRNTSDQFQTEVRKIHRAPSIVAANTIKSKVSHHPIKSVDLCRCSGFLPSLDSLHHRMQRIALEHDLTGLSYDTVAAMKLALHYYLKQIIMYCLVRLRPHCSEPPGETHDSYGYGMMRSSSVMISHSFGSYSDMKDNLLSSASPSELSPSITLKDLILVLELHPHLLSEELDMMEKIRSMVTTETELDSLARQMNEQFRRVLHHI